MERVPQFIEVKTKSLSAIDAHILYMNWGEKNTSRYTHTSFNDGSIKKKYDFFE